MALRPVKVPPPKTRLSRNVIYRDFLSWRTKERILFACLVGFASSALAFSIGPIFGIVTMVVSFFAWMMVTAEESTQLGSLFHPVEDQLALCELLPESSPYRAGPVDRFLEVDGQRIEIESTRMVVVGEYLSWIRSLPTTMFGVYLVLEDCVICVDSSLSRDLALQAAKQVAEPLLLRVVERRTDTGPIASWGLALYLGQVPALGLWALAMAMVPSVLLRFATVLAIAAAFWGCRRMQRRLSRHSPSMDARIRKEFGLRDSAQKRIGEGRERGQKLR